MTHYRNYKILVNSKPLDFFLKVEAFSNKYIEDSQSNCIEEQTKLGRIKQGDKVEFVFMYANT